jgi:hypothetical protein
MDLVKETERCKKSWELLSDKKIIRRRAVSPLKALVQFFSWFVNPHPVRGLYRMVKEEWLNDDENFRFPLSHVPISEAVKLDNGWTIPKGDVKYLYDGPLWTEDGKTCLVPPNTIVEAAKRWLGIWKLIAIALLLLVIDFFLI